MLYGKLNEEGTATDRLITLKEVRGIHTNVSIPADPSVEYMKALGYESVESEDMDLEFSHEYTYYFTATLDTESGKFVRTAHTEMCSEEEASERYKLKQDEVSTYIDVLLSESVDTQVADYSGNMKSEWVAYRAALKALQNNITTPYSVVYPDKPVESYVGTTNRYDGTLEEIQALMKKDVKVQAIAKIKYSVIDTGLGFSVDGGRDSLEDFKTGKELALPSVRDSDNIFHDATDEMYDVIILKIQQAGALVYQTKWAKEEKIDKLPDVGACIEYEHYPVQVDVTDENGAVTTETQYINKCTDW